MNIQQSKTRVLLNWFYSSILSFMEVEAEEVMNDSFLFFRVEQYKITVSPTISE